MSVTKDALQLDIAYYDTFTNRVDRDWGILFYNETQPNYYDSNHAHIVGFWENPKVIVEEVIDFYQSKNLVPRFYLYNLALQENLIKELKHRNFSYEALVNPIQLWSNQVVALPTNEKIAIEKVTAVNYQEALDIEGSIKEFGGRTSIEKVYEAQFNHPAFRHYLLRYEGKACATACIFEDNLQARIESVATAETYRGKGLIGYLMQYMQQETHARSIEKLWIFPINERVEKVYQKYNFDTVDTCVSAHVFLRGKSITEVRG